MSSGYEKAMAGIRERLARMTPEQRAKAIEVMQAKGQLVFEARRAGEKLETAEDVKAMFDRLKQETDSG